MVVGVVVDFSVHFMLDDFVFVWFDGFMRDGWITLAEEQ